MNAKTKKKRRRIRRLCAAAIAVSLLTPVIPQFQVCSPAADKTIEATQNYTVSDSISAVLDTSGRLIITGTGEMKDYSWNDSPWDDYKDQIKSIDISSGITSIGSNSFNECSRLSEITIPDTVSAIGKDAFYDCTLLYDISIPGSVTSIGDRAFYVRNKTTYTRMHGAASEAVKQYDWKSCNRELTYQIGEYAFGDAINGTVYDNGYLILRGQGQMYDASSDGIIPSEIRSQVTYIDIGDGITSIGENAFSGTSVKNVILGDDITSIGDGAFSDCSDLRFIEAGNGITSIGRDVFRCPGNKVLYVSTDNDLVKKYSWNSDGIRRVYSVKKYELTDYPQLHAYRMSDGTFYIFGYGTIPDLYNQWRSDKKEISRIEISGNICEIAGSAFYGLGNATEVSLSGCVNKVDIGSYAFSDCKSLSSIDLSDVSSVQNNAFRNCSALTEVNLGTSIEGIPDYMFSNCTSLKELSVPDQVTTIGSNAFYKCTSLSSITLGDSITTIGSGAFNECTSLEEITVPKYLRNVKGSLFKGDTALKKISLPQDMSTIPAYLFADVTTIEDVTIPENVRKIEEKAFYNCTGLKSITLPDKLRTISASAFDGCSALEAIELPESLKSIGRYAFNGCSSLGSIHIKDGVSEIGSYCFRNCTSLSEVDWAGSSIKSIESDTFRGCEKLTSIRIPYNVTDINSYAFSGASVLSDVKVNENLTSISSSAFDQETSALVFEGPADSYTKKFADEKGYTYRTAGTEGPLTLTVSGPSEGAVERTVTFTANPSSYDFIGKPVWTSSDTEVAEVKASNDVLKAEVTGESSGTATITVTVDGVSASYDITIVDKINSISLSSDMITFDRLYDSSQLYAYVSPRSIEDQKLIWNSSDPKVAYVGSDGLVIAYGKGIAKITVTDEARTCIDTCMVSVNPKEDEDSGSSDTVYTTGIRLKPDKVKVQVGKSTTVAATVEPSDAADSKVTWHSSNDLIAAVDENGRVTGISTGTAVISVLAEDGHSAAKCEVSVVKGTTSSGGKRGSADKKGMKFNSGNASYTLISAGKGTLTAKLTRIRKRSITSFTVPDTVKSASGKKYKVTEIDKTAFASCRKLKIVTFRSKNAPKIGKNAFRSISKKAVFRLPGVCTKAQKKLYKKRLGKAAGVSSTMKIR